MASPASGEPISARKIQDLRVIDLKAQLELRGIEKTGVKASLIDKLKKALEDEGHNAEEYMFEIDMKKSIKADIKEKEKDEDELEEVDEALAEMENGDADKTLTEETEAVTTEVTPEPITILDPPENLNLGDELVLNIEEPKEEEMNDEAAAVKETSTAGEVTEEPDSSEAADKEPATEEKPTESQMVVDDTEAKSPPVESSGVEGKDDAVAAVVSEVISEPPSPGSVPVIAPFTTEDTINLGQSCERQLEEDLSLIVHVDESQMEIDNDLLNTPAKQTEGEAGSSTPTADGGDGEATTTPTKTDDTTAPPDTTSSEPTPNSEKKSENKEGDKSKSPIAGKTDAKNAKAKAVPSNSRNLWISGLASSTRATDLKTLFSKYGKVAGAKVVTNAKSPGSRCYGFVTMTTADEASKCIQHLHRTELHGKMISVERAKTDPSAQAKIIPKAGSSTQKKDDGRPDRRDDRDRRSGGSRRPSGRGSDRDRERDRDRDHRHSHRSPRRHSPVSNRDRRDRSREVRDKDEKEKDKHKEAQNKDTPDKDAKDKDAKDKDAKDKDAKDKDAKDKTEDSDKKDDNETTASQEKKEVKDAKEKEEEREKEWVKKDKDILNFEKIKAERERERLKQRERHMREEERRRMRELDRMKDRQRQVERKQREESLRLEREKQRLRLEQQKLERDRLESERERISLERERQRRERERLEKEREQERIQQLRLEQERRAMKRNYDSRGGREDYWTEPKRPNLENRGRYDDKPSGDSGFERRVERYDRRESRPNEPTTRGGAAGSAGGDRFEGRRDDRHEPRRVPVPSRENRDRDDRGRTAEERNRNDRSAPAITTTRSYPERRDTPAARDHSGTRHERSPHAASHTGPGHPAARPAPTQHTRQPETRTEWKTERASVPTRDARPRGGSTSGGSRPPAAVDTYTRPPPTRDNAWHGTRTTNPPAPDDRKTHSYNTGAGLLGTKGSGPAVIDHGWNSGDRSTSNQAASTSSRPSDRGAWASAPSQAARPQPTVVATHQPLLQTPPTSAAFLASAANIIMGVGLAGNRTATQDTRYDAYKSLQGGNVRRY